MCYHPAMTYLESEFVVGEKDEEEDEKLAVVGMMSHIHSPDSCECSS